MPINPFVFRRIGLDTAPISEGGMMSPFVVSGDRVNTGFDSNIFNYGTYKGGSSMGDGVTSLGGGMGGIGGGVVGGEEARIAEQARLLEEARRRSLAGDFSFLKQLVTETEAGGERLVDLEVALDAGAGEIHGHRDRRAALCLQ